MRRRFIDARTLSFALLALAFAGCPGQVQQVQQQSQAATDFQDQLGQLRSLGAAYHRHVDTIGGAPTGWQQLRQSSSNAPQFQALEDAGCVVAWGKTFRDAPNGTSEFVLAYLPSALQNGGPVLMLDGSVTNLTADDLQQKLAAQNAPAP